MRPRRVTRSRVAAAVLSILTVTVAAIGYRLSDPVSDSQLVRAPLERPTTYQSGTVRVTDVRVGSVLQQGDDRFETPGLFVVVNVAVRATGRDDVSVADERLLTDDGATYLPAFSLQDTVTADPGFENARDLVFEVDPSRLSGLTLELWDSGFVYRYYERTQTPLGITPANEGQWVAAGRGRLLVVPSGDVTTALP